MHYLDANKTAGEKARRQLHKNMLYIGDKGVNVTACPPEGGAAKAGGLLASNLPLILIHHPGRMPDGSAKAGEVYYYLILYYKLVDILVFI